MEDKGTHIETAIVSRSPGLAYGRMYSMHRYWSKKSSDVVATYINKFTKEGDIVLDPFCGSGIVPCEAISHGRRAIAIDLNPMATFITKMTLTPINLSRLMWAFNDIKGVCEEAVASLFVTKCLHCGKDGIVDFVVRDGNLPVQIGYHCACSNKRLFKESDKRDKRLDDSFEEREVPFWYPRNVLLPIIQKEKFRYLHELFTKRNLIALSIILNNIEKIEDVKIKDLMKLAFTASLDKCSRLKPLSRGKNGSKPSLSEGWVAVRFYTPKIWQEVNPWYVFERSFNRVFEGKKESNTRLKKVVIGSSFEELYKGQANIIIFRGSADIILDKQLPKHSVDYILTDPPFGGHIQYLALSTFWGAWLKFDFDYHRELVVNRYRGKTLDDYNQHLGEILKLMRKVIKPNRYLHIFYHDVQGPYFHNMLKLMAESKILPERVLHQPPPDSFGAASREGKGHYGSYIVTGKANKKRISFKEDSTTENEVRKKLFEASNKALKIQGPTAPVGALLHSIYQSFSGKDILLLAQYPAEQFIKQSMKELLSRNRNNVQRGSLQNEVQTSQDIEDEIRKALLDAKSLYVKYASSADYKNQIYQRVLNRFQEREIPLERIRAVYDKISLSDLKLHRKKRILKLTNLLGQILSYECLQNDAAAEVVWKVNGNVGITFKILDQTILIKASKAMDKEDIASEIGTISDEQFEIALIKWCQNNPKKGTKLKKYLNAMEEFTSSSKSVSPKHLLLKVIENKVIENKVFENKGLLADYHLITLQVPQGKNFELQPGQFFHVICDPDGENTLTEDGNPRGYALTLRRPFSIHRIYYADFDRRLLNTPTIIPYEIKEVIERHISQIDILYKVVGEGTRNLSEVKSDTFLNVIGPIGNGFKIEKKVDAAVIVAGGIGVAPLVALAERLRYLGSRVFLYFGALRKELLLPILSRPDSTVDIGYANGTMEFLELITDEFKQIGAEGVRVCTDDGSLGEKGLVTEILERDIITGDLPRKNVTIYACGPTEMIKALSRIAYKHQIPCQALLEERMACGIGACFSCTCQIKDKNGKVEKKRVCVDGPVFDVKDIIWQS